MTISSGHNSSLEKRWRLIHFPINRSACNLNIFKPSLHYIVSKGTNIAKMWLSLYFVGCQGSPGMVKHSAAILFLTEKFTFLRWQNIFKDSITRREIVTFISDLDF